MPGRYAVVAARIRQELERLDQIVRRAERAVSATRQSAEHRDLFLDSAALSLHDFYAGLERIFRQIAADVDLSIPSGRDWQPELLRQMSVDVRGTRPKVLSAGTEKSVDEFLVFSYVVQNSRALNLDAERVELLVQRLRPAFRDVRSELLAFADFLDRVE